MHTEKIRDPELAQAVEAARNWERVAHLWIASSEKLKAERDEARAEVEKQKAISQTWAKVSETWRRQALVSAIISPILVVLGVLMAYAAMSWF